MPLKPITVNWIMRQKPCDDWPRERVKAILDRRDSWDALDVWRLKSVPLGDRQWVVFAREPRIFGLWGDWLDSHLDAETFPTDRGAHRKLTQLLKAAREEA